MGIDRFSPAAAGVPKEIDLEEKMTSSDVITGADIKAYAKFIAGHLNELKNKNESGQQELFIIDALSDSSLLKMVEDEVMSGQIDKNEAKSVIKRVRQALIDELKAIGMGIDEKIYLVIKDIVKKGVDSEKPEEAREMELEGATKETSERVATKPAKPTRPKATDSVGSRDIIDIIVEEPSAPKQKDRTNIISDVIDVASGAEVIHKQQEPLKKGHKADTEAAIKLFNKLDPHPNIVKILKYDKNLERIIYEKLNLQTLDKYLASGEKNIDKFVKCLEVVKDCIEGARYLAVNGLVLQDIKLDNLGLEKQAEEVKGVLFDLEGLFKTDTKMHGRMTAKHLRYLPPEILQVKGKKTIRPAEMVYQFGVCLQDILTLYEDRRVFKNTDKNAVKKLEILVKKMTEKNYLDRISLAEAKNELEDIVNELKE